jgi:hypothetical protein
MRAWNLVGDGWEEQSGVELIRVNYGHGGAKLERGMSAVKNGGAPGLFL